MAEVYLVLADAPAGFNKLQVLKLMRQDLSEQERPDFLRMFEDEARLAARLNHPNIVQSHEVGEDNGQPFIVMEYLDGQPLSRVQGRARSAREKFPLEMELFVLCQVLEALDYAHNLTDYDGRPLHIVHRDVSPQNVFITYAGQTKLVDFGVAKTLESSKTRAGVVKGKVAYMSPEQVRGGPLDHRADLFSVGVLLWEAIAGQPMYADLSVYESLNRLVRGELPSIREAVPDVADGLERILRRALASKPEERYPDADSFRADLHGYLEAQTKVRPRAVGEQVAQLFARERNEVNGVIRRALSAGPNGEIVPEDIQLTRIVPDFGSSPGFVHDATTPMRHTTPVPRTSAPPLVQATPSSPSPPAIARHPRLWLGGLLGAAALTAVASLLWTMRGAGEQVPSAEVGAVALPASHAEERAPVSVYIQAEPAQATLVLDGVRLRGNPYEGQRPRDAREHILEVSAPGHRGLRTSVRFEADMRLQLQLAELAAAEPPREERRHSRAEQREETQRETQRASRASERASRRQPKQPAPDDPYEELAPPKPAKSHAPELDRSDPWAAEQAR